jgi:hypothetical protein
MWKYVIAKGKKGEDIGGQDAMRAVKAATRQKQGQQEQEQIKQQ